jgi:hypothetical protein
MAAHARAAATTRTIGQSVPGPIQNSVATIPASEPTDMAVARNHGAFDRRHTPIAVPKRTAIVVTTPRPEFSHQPPAICGSIAATNPTVNGTNPGRIMRVFIRKLTSLN